MYFYISQLVLKRFTCIKSTNQLLLSSKRSISRIKNMTGQTEARAPLKKFQNIIKSPEDKRSYRGLELSNHMKVLLVSDPTTDKSAAALNVNVGFLSDPDYLPGLAHFCEHMLFLGTEKYPNENEYIKFLSEHSGSSNASTYTDHTVYYFDVAPDKLTEALDRFAQFFIAPLFTESATERELIAVNSEHEKNLPNDMWRMSQLEKHTCNPNHPYHKFGTGNKETLDVIPKKKGINVRSELLKFHEQWYSSNIMALAVLGKESLDDLEAIVLELFSNIQNKDIEAPRWSDHPFSDEQLRTCTYMVPIKDIRNLSINFPTEDLNEYYKSSPEGYISHLIGHEGPGSLLSALKTKGWSNSLVAGSRPGGRGLGFFGITVDLTEEGLQHTNDIIKLVFQYINMLKDVGPLEWIQEEQKDIAAMIFRFKDKESPRTYISGLVHHLQDYPIEDVLCIHYHLTEWRPDIINNILNSFTPDKVRIGVIAKKFQKEATDAEPWYGTQYKLEKIPQEVLNDWTNAGTSNEFRLPDKNDFIPTNFNIEPLDKDITEHPAIVQDTALTRVWFKQDDKFLLPKANLLFDFVSPLAYLDPMNCNMTHMLVQLFKDALNEYAYAAEIAGLKWELSNTKYGLILEVGGYSDKQHILLRKIMEKLTSFKIDPKRFEIFKENYIRQLKNFAAEQPYQHAVYYLAVLLTEHSWTKEELLASTDQLTIERLEAFIPQMLSKLHIECLLHGNLSKKRGLELVDIVETSLTSSFCMSPLLPRQLLLNRELKLDDGCSYLYEVQNNVHKLSCIELYFQCGLQNTENNVLLELFAQIIQVPCFNVLRTQEQLGYIVFSGVRRSNGVQGLRVIVQSDRHPEYLDTRIELFLESMLKHVMEMSNEEFERHKEALALQRLEKPKRLSVQSQIFWQEITSQQYHFDRANVEVAHLRKLTKDDIINYYQYLLDKAAKQRKKISVHVVSMADGGAGTSNSPKKEEKGSVEVIEDVTVFKSSHGMFPLVQPYICMERKGKKCKL
ncbi:insulin-degrading enzyme [Agrilus planipennis]|uniref:Insulin-degrading enzyme n=1 Tax=Agrilus planipennis TaxID=224129 RepID=A0A1W4X5N9_AGRPL|nr:insulin-degrading enzyme [Agrilus planipennis]XP_018331416.1 insulin-degrading enzyme [Agrilus planipennis]